MRATSNNADGARLRALIIVLWRAGLRISERSTSPRPSSTVRAAPSPCAEAKAAASRGRHGPVGVGTVDPVP